MRTWLLRAGNAYWNDQYKQWTSKEMASEFPDSVVEEMELAEGEMWVIGYETDD
jgi:hypothetical protein